MIILVGRPDTKTWWCNFTTHRDIDVLIQRTWLPMTARAVIGADEPNTVTPFLDAHLVRFPRAGRALGGDTGGSLAQRSVIVWCRPR